MAGDLNWLIFFQLSLFSSLSIIGPINPFTLAVIWSLFNLRVPRLRLVLVLFFCLLVVTDYLFRGDSEYSYSMTKYCVLFAIFHLSLSRRISYLSSNKLQILIYSAIVLSLWLFKVLYGLRSGLHVYDISLGQTSAQSSMAWLFVSLSTWNLIYSSKFKKTNFFLLVVAFFILFLINSRTYLLVGLIGLLLLLIKRKLRITLFLASLMLIVIVVNRELVYQKIGEDYKSKWSRMEGSNAEEITTGRVLIWRQVYENFTTSKLLGLGVGNAAKGYKTWDGITPRAHNLYMQVLGDWGLFGFIPLVFFSARALIVSFRNLQYNPIFVICIQASVIALFKADSLIYLLLILIVLGRRKNYDFNNSYTLV